MTLHTCNFETQIKSLRGAHINNRRGEGGSRNEGHNNMKAPALPDLDNDVPQGLYCSHCVEPTQTQLLFVSDSQSAPQLPSSAEFGE